jgi:hypothetical protein
MKSVIYLATALAALALLGCGGSGSAQSGSTVAKSGSPQPQPASSTESSQPPLSKAELIKQGDAICTNTDKVQKAKLTAYFKAHPKARGSQVGLREAVLVAGIGPIRDEAKELGELQPPAGDEKEIAAIVEGIEAAVKASEADPVTALTAGLNPFNGVDELAGKYGFKACANAL